MLLSFVDGGGEEDTHFSEQKECHSKKKFKVFKEVKYIGRSLKSFSNQKTFFHCVTSPCPICFTGRARCQLDNSGLWNRRIKTEAEICVLLSFNASSDRLLCMMWLNISVFCLVLSCKLIFFGNAVRLSVDSWTYEN